MFDAERTEGTDTYSHKVGHRIAARLIFSCTFRWTTVTIASRIWMDFVPCVTCARHSRLLLKTIILKRTMQS